MHQKMMVKQSMTDAELNAHAERIAGIMIDLMGSAKAAYAFNHRVEKLLMNDTIKRYDYDYGPPKKVVDNNSHG